MTLTLSAEARSDLLRIARRSLEAAARGSAYEPESDLDAELRAPAGAFVSLHRRADGALRGCIGCVEARSAVGESVARAAYDAALHDPRFPPVTPDETEALVVDVSVLEPPSPIAPGEVVVGRHGLIVERQGRRGLLLPQVPVEWGWDREAFLDQVCVKAGLPKSAWRSADATLLGFEATVFGEEPSPKGIKTGSSGP